MKKRVMVLWYLAVMTVSMSAQQITKVFHHQMPKDDLELGQIVFYFADQPIIKTLHSSGKKHELVYFFPDATLSPGAHAAAQALQETPLYKVTLKEVERPRGVKFIITFDTTKVMPPQYESFVAITRDKGLVFHLYNKELLHELELQHINKALLQVASHTAPRVVIDCGHGGDDCGAVGILANAQKVAEKDITMSVGLELAQQLRKHGIEVLLTRSV
ncbi:MAG TPA: N-acetylmuramoyl-L-alanine amidase, partial [Candidatus Limnocylindria bacterium]|nr:N-acetylmuramoyl-L-alanine amidase [Candidatus Limnocylindria bacterium]